MNKRLPVLSDKYKVCIICEGDEEYDYLNKLKSLQVWNEKYEFHLVNSEGNGNISARYQDRYQNGSYELVLIFCDTEREPFIQYFDIKRKINEFHGLENAADEVVIYGNPCTMQIILKHWTDNKIESPAKKNNAEIIEQYTGVKNYKARFDQRNEIMTQINIENYIVMRDRVLQMEDNDTLAGTSNFGKFIKYFESKDTKWIEEINNKLQMEENYETV